MKRLRWMLLPAIACLAAGSARKEPEERIALLEHWQEAPLELARAGIDEIALLPGLDADLAEAVVGLRALGELHSLDDLRRVPGIGPAGVDALRPYVVLEAAPVVRGATWSGVGQQSGADAPRWRQRFRGSGGGVFVEGAVVDALPRRWRGAATARLAIADATVGDTVLDVPGGLFDAASSRSRLAPARAPRRFRVRARTDAADLSGWTGIAVHGGPVLLFGGRSPGGHETVGAALDLRATERAIGVAMRFGPGPIAVAVECAQRRDGLRTWFSIRAEGRARAAALGVRARGTRWRAGADASAADARFRFGSDDVTGHRLDRLHRVVQVHGRLRGSGWSVGGIWRGVERGRPAAVDAVGTVEFEFSWQPGVDDWPVGASLIFRAAPVRRATLVTRHRTGARELRLRFSRESDGSGGADILGLDCRVRAGRAQVHTCLVGVEGSASRAWMMARPGTGIYPVWIRPGGVLIGGGIGLESAGWQFGAWLWLRADTGRPPAPGAGISVGLRAGRMVRRLQGEPGRRRAPSESWRPDR